MFRRMFEFVWLALLCLYASDTFSQAPPSSESSQRHFSFALKRGEGTPVCEALLQRLNQTVYKDPPYCGIPEDDSVPGFTQLPRKQLSGAEGRRLHPEIWVFSSTGGHALIGKTPPGEDDIWNNRYRGTGGDWNAVPAWRYAKPVDVENNGKPDNVVVWQGLEQNFGANCGQFDVALNEPDRVTQQAFIMRPKYAGLDAKRTRDLFYRPPLYVTLPRGQVERIDRPIGSTVDFFEYRGAIYFGGFYGAYDAMYGDFEGNRKFAEPPKMTPSFGLGNIFDLFQRRNGSTAMMCEYEMKVK